MINSHLYTLIMAGGHGTRFWPESTRAKPKQYLSLVGDQSLLYQTLARFEGMVSVERRFLVTTKDQASLAINSGAELFKKSNLILEPAGRNTAPCILLSLVELLEKGAQDEDVVAIVPSDHIILNTKGFQETLRVAFENAVAQEKIVTVGIKPHFPHTGYGYIHRGEETRAEVFKVQSFKEKPDRHVAEGYVASGEYYWNAGMFVSRIDVLLQEFASHAPDVFSFFSELKEALEDRSRLSEVYQKINKDSIDYAVMEKSAKILVVPAQFDWNDLGSWDALEGLCETREGNNTLVRARELFTEDAKGNIVFAPDKFVALVGVDDLVVALNKDSLLVMKKTQSQKVKSVVEFLNGQSKLKDLI